MHLTLSYFHFEDVETIIKSEMEDIKERNKHLKIAYRHGWDTVREYTLHPLADNTEDANKLRTAIIRASRKRSVSKPYDRKTPSASQVSSYGGSGNRSSFRFRGQVSQPAFTKDSATPVYAPGSCFLCHLPGHFAKQCTYTNRQFAQRFPTPATATRPSGQQPQQ